MNASFSGSAGPLVLLVDDNRDAVTILARLLELKGYSVHTCYNGQAALEAAERLRPAWIVLDLAMPDLDGFSVGQWIRAQPWGANLLLVALSGYIDERNRARTQAAGFNAHLAKPVDLGQLLDLLGEPSA